MLGSAWYPEQWPEERWITDLELMQRAGLTVARIAEYSWCRIEPEEGVFDLDWLVRAIDLAQNYGIRIVMSTPVDAPPAWMTERYPEVLRVAENGAPEKHGGRRHFNPSSEKYRQLSTRISAALAGRVGQHPNVIGWQIGNEFCRYSYDAETRKHFQAWLRERYGTLDELNRRWSTTYWCQHYSDWSQIHLPVGWQNPCLDLAFFYYISEAFRQFQRVQIDAIREHANPTQWITHNIHGFDELDFVPLISDTDIASWDPYAGGNGKVDHLSLGWTSDFCRTLRPRAHWIMEAQPGHINWAPPNLSLPRGAIRAMVWHFIAHGAEAVLFWQWRSALGGQEQYHGTLVGADGTPRPLLAEVTEVGREWERLTSLLTGTRVQSSVAVLYRYVDQVAIKRQRHAVGFDPHQHMLEFYAPLRAAGHDVDIIHDGHPFEGYPLLVAPHVHCMDDALATKLADYVRCGGHLLLGPRSGFKDESNAMLQSRQPGTLLGEMLGATVDDYYTVDRPVEVTGTLGKGYASVWAEPISLSADDVEVLLSYGTFNGWIDNRPAAVSRAAGKGRISYLGTWPDSETMAKLVAWATQISVISKPDPVPPASVEVCRRVGDGRELLVLINHGISTQRVSLSGPMTDALTGTTHPGFIDLLPYAVGVLQKN